MDGSDIGYIIGILICIVLSGFFSASETAYTTLNVIRLNTAAENGDTKAAQMLRLANSYDKLLSTILVGNNIVNIAAASMATILFTKYFPQVGAPLSTVVMTILVLIFGEISPKSMAKEHAEGFARFALPFLQGLVFLLTPINFLFSKWKKLLSRLFKGKDSNNKMTHEELKTIVNEAQGEGGIDEENGELIRSAIEFDDLDAGDVLTPRVDLVAVDKEMPFEEISKVFLEHTYSRLPVYEGSLDDIVGMIHEKDYYEALCRGEKDVNAIIKKVIYISSSVKISDLLRALQHHKLHMAVVVDEFGGTEGIVTVEDIIEELVGDIWDEHDVVVDSIKTVNESTWIVDCGADLEEVFQFFQLELPSGEEYEPLTVNGWLMDELDKIPSVGDAVDYGGYHMAVSKATAKHAVELTVTRQPAPGTQEAAGGHLASV